MQETSPASPTPTELEVCHVDRSLLQEQVARLRAQYADLEARYNSIVLSIDRERITPKRDGWLWDWTLDQATGRPRGFVPTPAPAQPEKAKKPPEEERP